MKKESSRALVVVAFIIMLISASAVYADDIEQLSGMRFVQLARGGLLYDNWPVELGKKINKTHPSYPETGGKKGQDTWRCKECHGWDYKGKEGSYSSGSHYTGITGIRAYEKADPIKIVNILKDDTHAFGDLLSDNDYDALALFVSMGQFDMDIYIDRKTRESIGDASAGGRVYLATCVRCHGVNGKDIKIGHDGVPKYIGTSAQDNPWETIHKIRWGHPGTPMVSLLFLGLKEQLDVLSFCQVLPAE